MKLNFWQWIGVICLVIGAIIYLRSENKKNQPADRSNSSAPNQLIPSPSPPTTTPANAPTP
ncbi:MAG: hypothetical protein IT448_12460 [Phycisphaerales bacterium]|nr:hypothetical protein [Phycisphaerales bacterium]